MMQWDVIIHDDLQYAEIITSGIADKEGSLSMAQHIAETMKRQRITKVLVDHSKIESVSGTITDIYDRPKVFRIIGVLLRIKIAEIVRSEHEPHFRFLETVCINRGYKFSIFQDRKTALKWLLG